ncbi:MAG: phosphotransferase family protein [Solirubrobacteraceae bacterium]|nr:phosphotransferase family protein [Solirubrobacteraceae bacterium]
MHPGIDHEPVVAWLRGVLPDLREPASFVRVGDGRSNLTYRVEGADGHRWILRRPPLGPRLPSAHDMVREHRLIAALHPAGIPVPEPLGLCEDEAVTGAPFYVMEHADGHVLASREAADPLTHDARRTAGLDLVDTLARLHAVDVDAVGLGDLGRHHGYGERQLRRWIGQWAASKTREVPAIERVHARLEAGIPTQHRVSIVHGDYKLENVIVGDDGRVRAILDWELCTLGDPLADLGLLLVYWTEPGDPEPRISTAPLADGFPSRDEVVARYADASGLDLSGLPFYRALGAWKLAIILQGVVRRFRETPGNANVDPESLDPIIDVLAAQAERVAEDVHPTDG